MSHWSDRDAVAYLRQLPMTPAIEDAQSSARALGLLLVSACTFLIGIGVGALAVVLLR